MERQAAPLVATTEGGVFWSCVAFSEPRMLAAWKRIWDKEAVPDRDRTGGCLPGGGTEKLDVARVCLIGNGFMKNRGLEQWRSDAQSLEQFRSAKACRCRSAGRPCRVALWVGQHRVGLGDSPESPQVGFWV